MISYFFLSSLRPALFSVEITKLEKRVLTHDGEAGVNNHLYISYIKCIAQEKSSFDQATVSILGIQERQYRI